MIDIEHAGDKANWLSWTAFLVYMNMALITWLYKKQPNIEISVFGADFLEMKTRMEALRELRCKLHMMGVPFTGPSYIYGDTLSAIQNTQRLESTLKNKNNPICYHAMWESVAMIKSLTSHICAVFNLANIFEKKFSRQ